MPTRERWNEAWSHAGVTAPAGLFERIIAAYAEPHRAYHTLQHLDECLASLAPAAHLAHAIGSVELALWFHDAIYDTRAKDSEVRSARWARKELSVSGVTPDVAESVEALVLATRHDVTPADADARLLVDVDLSILSAPAARFDEYEAQVRIEYGWVPEDAFREGRSRVLRTFLDRPAIFSTPWFRDRCEARARQNLARSLARLTPLP